MFIRIPTPENTNRHHRGLGDAGDQFSGQGRLSYGMVDVAILAVAVIEPHFPLYTNRRYSHRVSSVCSLQAQQWRSRSWLGSSRGGEKRGSEPKAEKFVSFFLS